MRRRGTFFALSAVWLALWVGLLSCDSSGLVGGSCQFGLTSCEHRCVDLGSDAYHCGACGQACEFGQDCLAGNCMRHRARAPAARDVKPMMSIVPDAGQEGESNAEGGSASGGNTGAGGVSESGGAENGGAEIGGGPVSDNRGGAGASPSCPTPHSSADHCGECETVCALGAPYCAPKSDSFACANECDAAQLLCGERCVNPLRDPAHCSACDESCSTGICRNGECAPAAAGHIVMMCISFEDVSAESPQASLLGNSIFLTDASVVRVLVYERGASNQVRFNARRALGWASNAVSRPFEVITASSAQSVVEHLNVASYDVFWILDLRAAKDGALAQLGRTLSPVIDSFTQSGGVVIFTHGAETPGAVEFLNEEGAALLDVVGLENATFRELQNQAPTDPVGLNIPTPFTALVSTCTYETQDMPSDGLEIVVTANSENRHVEAPVVVHRVVPPQAR